MNRIDWIKKYGPDAVAAAKDTNIFPSVMLSQAILESSGKVNGVYEPGQSLLSKNANNYFGIKASAGWVGPVISLKTGEFINGQYVTVTGVFRKYNTIKDSFTDYINFLKVNPRYAAAGVFSATTAQQQADALQRAGYATDPLYASKIKSIIQSIQSYIPSPAVVAAGGGALLASLIVLYFYNKKK
jgi:mannosyl-glycoprotein endo-beta-N-acetylglucosaminidase/stage II sporulation protein P